jgi:hypothetical protein
MNEMQNATAAKSDQLNVEDLIGSGPLTITITKVTNKGGQDQPVSVFYEGDNGKPYKPCKSMCRVMVQVWGGKLADYVGKRMTLYVDQDVEYGGMKVGGLRISHMSDLGQDTTLMLTRKRGQKKPYLVHPLQDELLGFAEMKNLVSACPVEELPKWGALIPDQAFTEAQMDELREIYRTRRGV